MILLLIITIFSLLPLRVLYRIGDVIIYPILYHVVRYRRKVVRKNLEASFPDLTHAELKKIEKRFYHHFVDVIEENIWSYRATEEQMREHMVYANIEDIERWVEEKGGVFFMLGHLGNWEWTPDIQHRYADGEIHQYNVYRKQKHEQADKAILAMREKRSGEGSNVEKNKLLREMVGWKQSHKKFTLGLVADQKPSPSNAHYWTTFLNQDTAFLQGGELLAKRFDYAVTYVHMTCKQRGQYVATVQLITDDATHTAPNEITEKYARLLEQNILEQPEQWLWTHNRWKWGRAAKKTKS